MTDAEREAARLASELYSEVNEKIEKVIDDLKIKYRAKEELQYIASWLRQLANRTGH
jgi:phosphopantothenate synthetase